MPKIVEPEQLPNIYTLKEENKDNANENKDNANKE